MFIKYEGTSAYKADSKQKKVLKTVKKGAVKVWKYCKSAVVKYFDDMMKQEFIIVKNGIIYKKGCDPRGKDYYY